MQPSTPQSSASLLLLLGSAALFACWLAPGHYYPWVNFQNEFVAAIALLLIGAAAVASGHRLPWPALSSVIMLAALVAVVQWAAGQINFRSDALLALLYLTGFALSIAVGAALFRSRRDELLGGVCGAILAAGLVSNGMALFQWLQLGPTGYVAWIAPGQRPFANLAQPNHLASLLALALLSALWLYESRRIGGRTMWIVALWLGLGLVMARSRTTWVALPLFVLGWFLMQRRWPVRLRGAHLMIWFTLFWIGVLLWGPLNETVGTGTPISLAQRVQADGGRLRIWAVLVEALLASPWVGYGWSQVSHAGLLGSLHHFTGETMLRNSHSTPLDLLLWNGVPLGLFFIGALAWWWVVQLRRCVTAEAWVVLSAVGVVFVHALFEFPLEYLHFLLPVGLLMGALDGMADGPCPTRSVPRAAVGLAIAGLAGATAWIGTEYLRVEEGSRANRMLAAGYAASADLPDVVLLDEPREYMRFWRTEARAGMNNDELDWMRKVAERNPAPPTLLRYALATGLNARPQEAARTLVQLCNMHRPVSCDEGRQSWSVLQQRFDVLHAIAYPPPR
jgi:Virulence factor membrane-bound polymerase, C-terminal/Protein glycosylation ligase/O-Antigen ligase